MNWKKKFYKENVYDNNNIFAQIINGKIPCKKIYEDKDVLFFEDINPVTKVHVLGIPKAPCINLLEFVSTCDESVVANFFQKIDLVVEKLGIKEDGYRIITNTGINGGQEVPHFHIHILGGEKIGSKNL